MNAEVIAKATGAVTEVPLDAIDLTVPSIVRLDITRAEVAGFERQGHDLVVRLVNGEQIRIADFYAEGAALPNDLVLRETDGSQWLARADGNTPRFSVLADLEELTGSAAAAGGGSGLTIPAILGGLGAAGAVAAVAASGGGGDARSSGGGATPDPDPVSPAPDRDPPATPTATVRGDGRQVDGRGEAGATVQVRDASGTLVGTATVGADGAFSAPLATPRVNGEPLSVTQTDAAGNVSPPAQVQAPDLTAPAQPAGTVDAAGTVVTGTGEPGARVTVTGPGGVTLGSATVAADGSFQVPLGTAQANGQALTVVQADAAGNVSPPLSLAAPDTTPPDAPTATIAPGGAAVVGTAEPGATVTVTNPAGTTIGSAVAGADGGYTVPIAPSQPAGDPLAVVQTDRGGNVSPPVTVVAGGADSDAPDAPTAALDATGTIVTGTGEAGATVTVTGPGGTLAFGTVGAGGSYTVVLPAPQIDGEPLSVVQADAAGNVSPPATLTAPDLTAPAAPVAAVSADGAQVTGTGEPGASVTVTVPGGAAIGTATVGADGSFAVPLSPVQSNGGTLAVVQVDTAGNASSPTTVSASDLVAPDAPAATLDPTGGVVTGTGEPGAVVTVTGTGGAVLGTATVTAQGSFTVVLSTPQVDSQALAVVQRDGAGNASPATGLTAPDLTAPAAPTAVVAADGAGITGRGEPGATVTVRSPVGALIGTAVVVADGTYAAALAPSQVDGETLSVRQADPAGNVSPPAAATAPDLAVGSDPAAPTAQVTADGAAVTGTALAGATITVHDAGGRVVATGTAAADGRYTVALAPALIDAEIVRVTQTAADGDVSPPATATAPDLTAPAAPAAALDATGAVVTGTGEPGATVSVRAADGTLLGSATVSPAGGFVVTLGTPQTDGEPLSVTQADAAGNVSPATTLVADDLTAPTAPTATVSADGASVTGIGEPGATVTVTSAGGATLATAIVAADGSYIARLSPAQANGGTLTVGQADAAGNASPSVAAIAPDITAPAAPTAALDATGLVVTGTGEPGATVSVRAADGSLLGSATVTAAGTYAATLLAPQVDGQRLAVTQADTAGNVSPRVTLTAPDATAPLAPTATVSADGAQVTGTGEPGARITITDPAGAAIGTAVVAADGRYVAALSPPRLDGERLTAVQADPAGNASPPATALAPDLTPPVAPSLAIATDGALASGSGEVGARVTLRGADGAIVGTATVGADGRYAIALAPPRVDGEAFTATQADAAGNVSPAAAATAPDLDGLAGLSAQVSADGATVTGEGEAGATVTIRDPAGLAIGSAQVGVDGAYTVALTPRQVNGEVLTATQADATGAAGTPVRTVAPDLTAPAAPTATVIDDGGAIAGTGEAGARVTVTAPGVGVVATAVVGVDGSFTVPLTPPQANGERLTVVQVDAAGNVSPAAAAVAPDLTAPAAPVFAIAADGIVATGTGEPGARVTVTAAGGGVIGTAVVGADGSFTVPLTPAQTAGGIAAATQADAAGNVSPPATAPIPDLVAPGLPVASVAADGASVVGTGEPGATVIVTAPGAGIIGTALVGTDGSYTATLDIAQRNGEALSVAQRDAAGNLSGATAAIAPDLTAPPPPANLAVAEGGAALTGTGEAGARVEVRGPAGALLGSGTVDANGSFSVALAPAVAVGTTLSVTQADAARNVSGAASVTVAIDIDAFDNVDTAVVDLVLAATPVNYGTAPYLALVSLGLVNLDAQVLSIPSIGFTVAPNHRLDAVFTYDAAVDIGVASNYAVAVQRFDGTRWVSLEGGTGASLLAVGLLNGNLSATDVLGPGQYRAFLTFDGALGVGVLGSLNVSGVDLDLAAPPAVPEAATGNVITDPGPGGEIDVAGPGTRVASVGVGAAVTTVAAGGTLVTGAWGTLLINPDGSYTYTPNASAAAIGKTDVFTYTIADPAGGPPESATLSITIGSPDITGAPVAVADQAVASVTFQTVVATAPIAPAFSFGSQPGTGILAPSTGAGGSSLTVAPGGVADVTITAIRDPGLSVSLLPTYTLSISNGAGYARTETLTSVAGLPIGTGVAFVLDDLPAGTYSYTVTSNALLGTFGTTVSVGSVTTFPNSFEVATRETVTGDLFANDTANALYADLRIGAGIGGALQDVGTTASVAGRFGTLTVDESGHFSYLPSATLGYSAVDLVDTFTYQIVQPNGVVATSTLSVTIDVPADGTIAAATNLFRIDPVEDDVAALGHIAASPPTPADAADASAAAYDLFEGRGELEDILSHYLGQVDTGTANGSGEITASATLADAVPGAIADPLGYLVLDVDQHHLGINANPVV